MRRHVRSQAFGAVRFDFIFFFSPVLAVRERMGEARTCSHIHTATPAGCNNSSSAGEQMLTGSFLQREDW